MIGIIGSDTTRNYGLFQDIINKPDIKVFYTEVKKSYTGLGWKILRKINADQYPIFQQHMSWEKDFLSKINLFDEILVIDTALRELRMGFLNECLEHNPQLRIGLLLLNSVTSITLNEKRVKSKIEQLTWTDIFTFDPSDARKKVGDTLVYVIIPSFQCQKDEERKVMFIMQDQL